MHPEYLRLNARYGIIELMDTIKVPRLRVTESRLSELATEGKCTRCNFGESSVDCKLECCQQM